MLRSSFPAAPSSEYRRPPAASIRPIARSVHETPADPLQGPDDDCADLAARYALDRLVTERPRAIAAPVKLLEYLDQLQALPLGVSVGA